MEREKAKCCAWFSLRFGVLKQNENTGLEDHNVELNTLFGANSGATETPSNSRTQLDDLFTAPADDP